MRRLLPVVCLVLAFAAVPAASAVGPSLPVSVAGAADPVVGAGVSYGARLTGGSTTLLAIRNGKVVRSHLIAGRYGVPVVALTPGGTSGLSPNGRVLVLGDNVDPSGALRTRSRFAVVDTRALRVVQEVALRGDYSFDALSATGRTLFLIHHLAAGDGQRYQVRAFDLARRMLLPGVIADKRQAGWVMDGMPVSRATSPGGRWVYTLYQASDNYPFVHMLDTRTKTAVCVALPWQWTTGGASIPTAKLSLAGSTLHVVASDGSTTRFAIDTRTLDVSASGPNTTA